MFFRCFPEVIKQIICHTEVISFATVFRNQGSEQSGVAYSCKNPQLLRHVTCIGPLADIEKAMLPISKLSNYLK